MNLPEGVRVGCDHVLVTPKKTAKPKRARAGASTRAAANGPSLRTKRDQVKRGIALLTRKEIDKTLTPAERTLLHGLREELSKINGRLHPSKKAKAPKGKRVTQGPAGGIRSVVSGGAPGLGKRS